LTRAKSASLDEFANALDDRLTVLARNHALLSQLGRNNVGVREILKQELSAQGAVEGQNVRYHGPEVFLSNKQVQVLAMAFHELATNAVKHGALSVETHECRNRDTGTSAKCEKKRPPVSGLLRVLCIFSTTKACCNNRTPPYHGSGQTNPSQCYD